MQGVVNSVYYCQQQRTQELNNRLNERNHTNVSVNTVPNLRSVPTRYVKMPTGNKSIPTSSPLSKMNCIPIYNTNTMFMPSSSLPFNGYQANVDVETKLRNTIFPLQSCPQSKYIPSTQSDMFNSTYLVPATRPVTMSNQLLFTTPNFSPSNPNTCNVGYKLFNNATRTQVRNMD